jgi:hypothetical protein
MNPMNPGLEPITLPCGTVVTGWINTERKTLHLKVADEGVERGTQEIECLSCGETIELENFDINIRASSLEPLINWLNVAKEMIDGKTEG